MLKIEFTENEKELSFLNDPFKIDGLESINIFMGKGILTKKIKYVARLKFIKGDTSGTHKIEAQNFEQLIINIKSVLESIDGKTANATP